MSSIWTPGGEHEVPRSGQAAGEAGPRSQQELSAEEQARLEEAAREVAAVQAQVAAAPPEQIVANHLMGLYELAAIHLSRPQPDLAAARLAIDAAGAALDAARGRLGEVEATVTGWRTQIQLAFVAAAQRQRGEKSAGAEGSAAGAGGSGAGAGSAPGAARTPGEQAERSSGEAPAEQ